MSNNNQNIKYQHILSAGKELFWKHGIRRVSVEEICSHAKVSKMTFYKFFKNKRELSLEILKKIVDYRLKKYEAVIHKDYAFTDKVEDLIKMKLESTKDIGQEFIADIYQNRELGLMPYMEEQINKSLTLTMEFLLDSQKKGYIRQDIKVDFILHYFNHMLQMASDPELLSKYEKPQDLIMEATEFFFYGIGAKHLDK